MTNRLKRRARRSAGEWSHLVAEWRESGLAAEVFAAQRGLSRTSLFKWTARLNRQAGRPASSGKFVAVDVVANGSASSSSSPTALAVSPTPSDDVGQIELVTLSGRVIRWSGRIDADALAGVLKVAERC